MKPVAQKPLPQIPKLEIQSQEFWNYTIPTKEELESLDLFLNPNALLISSYLPQPISNLEETYLALCQMIQIRPHPSIKQKSQRPPQNLLAHQDSVDSIPPAQIEQSTVQFLIFQNTQIDMITLKLVNYLWQFLPNLQVLKIFNIFPTTDELNEICSIIQKNKVMKLFLEFLQVDNDKLIQMCEIIPKSVNIIQLYLRGNRLDDGHLSVLLKSLEENNISSNLRFIEMTHNNITKKGVLMISQYMKKLNKIEYIGLAKNQLGAWDDIKELSELLIRKKLTPEELQSYRDLEVQREAQIKAQLKLKGKKGADEIQIIQLEPIAQNPDGSYQYVYYQGFSIIQNVQFKVLNLAMNSFSDTDKDHIDRFMGQVQETFQLILIQNNFEAKVKDKLKKKYKNLVI